ncbi:MAG: DNA methyltransferase, partial [Thermoplasmata archaeon]
DLYGLREDKYSWLDRHTVNNTEWQEIKPVSPFYFFIPKNNELLEEYEKFWKVTDIFSVNSVGIVTSRDNFVIDFNKETLKQRMGEFRNNEISDEYIRSKFKLKDKKNWKLADARKNVMKNEDWENSITRILYRPFDTRYIFYDDAVVERSRREVMQHMLRGANLGLIFHKREELQIPYSHFLVTKNTIEHGSLSSKTTCYLSPLYLYSDSKKKPNLNTDFLEFVSEKYGREISPEEIFYYIYAVLHSPTYRKKYEEFLQYDFPRIPFVDDYEKFKQLSELGKELVELHLMKKKLPVHTKFDVQGSNMVEKVGYENDRVFINDVQYFDNVSSEVWNFHIGGYQVCQKWLKDRKGRKLTEEDINHYQKIIVAIDETIKIMKEIDKTIDEHGGWPMK